MEENNSELTRAGKEMGEGWHYFLYKEDEMVPISSCTWWRTGSGNQLEDGIVGNEDQ